MELKCKDEKCFDVGFKKIAFPRYLLLGSNEEYYFYILYLVQYTNAHFIVHHRIIIVG
jgi:hypothetical protein